MYSNDSCIDDGEICRPIGTLEAILEWIPPASNKPAWNVLKKLGRSKSSFECTKNCYKFSSDECTVPEEKESVPKTLYCHDMKGGYLEDKYVKGCEAEDPFTFFRWSGIDIFIYFSHCFITIPPLTWINAAHANGVTVLGTIITEGEPGRRLCAKLLQNEILVKTFSSKLAQICGHYGFSGYLLNIENSIHTSDMPLLVILVTELREQLKRMNPNNILLWYDAVTREGNLVHQNELNDYNSVFFDNTDGIFVNYGWNRQNLNNSLKNANKRKHDVFVGIDVFGRGVFGGGGFQTWKAMKEIRSCSLSAALFAPGWVHENQTSDQKFMARDYLFWKEVFPYLYLSGPTELPFSSSFSVGRGLNLYEKGTIVKSGCWYNLNKQEFQVSDVFGWKEDKTDSGCIHFYDKDAYNGGNCLLLTSQHFDRLFVCEFVLESNKRFKITAITKDLANETDKKGGLEVLVKYLNEDSLPMKSILKSEEVTDDCENWQKRLFFFGPNKDEVRVAEIGVRVVNENPVCLGQFSIEEI